MPEPGFRLLDLPAAIQNMIYSEALVCGIIDLHPLDILSRDEEPFCHDASLRRKKTEELDEPDCPCDLHSLRFCHQKDLDFVRKHLSVNLLRTCTRVYNEAAQIFWQNNTFQFSGDTNWKILYRFLITIGPVGRQRIQRLNICNPWESRRKMHRPPMPLDNVPKLHMHKVHVLEFIGDYIRPVLQMLKTDKINREFNVLLKKPLKKLETEKASTQAVQKWRASAPFPDLESGLRSFAALQDAIRYGEAAKCNKMVHECEPLFGWTLESGVCKRTTITAIETGHVRLMMMIGFHVCYPAWHPNFTGYGDDDSIVTLSCLSSGTSIESSGWV